MTERQGRPTVAPGEKLEELEDLFSLITSASIYVPNQGWGLWVFCPHRRT